MKNTVSIHPYFKVHAGSMEAAQAILPAFLEQTPEEEKCLYYEFTVDGDMVFCREAYAGGEAALAHLSNVSEQLDAMLKVSTLARLEIHGSAEELEKLRVPLAALNPSWFVYAAGLEK